MGYSITCKLAITPDWRCHSIFMLYKRSTGKILAPNHNGAPAVDILKLPFGIVSLGYLSYHFTNKEKNHLSGFLLAPWTAFRLQTSKMRKQSQKFNGLVCENGLKRNPWLFSSPDALYIRGSYIKLFSHLSKFVTLAAYLMTTAWNWLLQCFDISWPITL